MVLTDKEVKKIILEKAKKNPAKYYPIEKLKIEGFVRKICKKCGKAFWTTQAEREVCGDSNCVGGFSFIGQSPAREKLSYVEVWQEFAKFFKSRGYEPIKRYPVVARWRQDSYFVQASIYDFQPYVVSGEVEPPAKMLVVPQFSLRFNDIENVGITGSHYTGFVMIGQHAFMTKEEWDQEKYFTDIFDWLHLKLKIPKEELTFHEDAWAGGGNFGPSMEFFSRGLELGNQVYMMFEKTEDSYRELNLKVLDMGTGQERTAWFTTGSINSYEVVFKETIKKLRERATFEFDFDLARSFSSYGAQLNLDEVENIEVVWKKIADALQIPLEKLKEQVLRHAALYSIAEHTRSLLIAISDGALPSNVGGGYNLRIILRRALNFLWKYKFNVEIEDVAAWHAQELKKFYPELSEDIEHVKKILSIEKKKYLQTRERNKRIVAKLTNRKLDVDELIKLYESYGISIEEIKEAFEKENKKFEVPPQYYAKLTELHASQKKEQKSELFLPLEDVEETERLYYEHFDLVEFEGKVLKIIKESDNKAYVVLNRTAFYPTSGGQLHDTGYLNNSRVVDVFVHGKHVVHVVEGTLDFKEGSIVKGKIDWERRFQLAQHHTATHIINGCAKKILGKHVWQAGTIKTPEKARLDITHYEALDYETLKKIEECANEIVNKNLPVYKTFLKRNVAEAKYGFRIYQGGAVPGKVLRIVEIPGHDVEACGGTHLDVTADCEVIKILKASKIQDGVVRIEFVAGEKAKEIIKAEQEIVEKLKNLLKVRNELELPSAAEDLFERWKIAKKYLKKKSYHYVERLKAERKLEMVEEGTDIVKEVAKVLKTQPEHVVKTVERFSREVDEVMKLIND